MPHPILVSDSRACRLWRNLSFPKALWPLVTPTVLVETFEQGQLVQRQSACHTLSWCQICVRAGCGAT